MNIIHALIPPLAVGMGAHFLADFLTGRSIAFAHKRQLLAHPNERSSHTEPTPRVGGIGLVWGALIPLVAYLVFSGQVQQFQGILESDIDPVQWRQFAGLLSAVILAFALGLWDDRGDPPAVAKLAGQLVIAAIPPAFGLIVYQVYVPGLGPVMLPVWVGVVVAYAWVLLMMNVVNFMDGINGLAGRFGEVFGIAFCVFAIGRWWSGETFVLGAAIWGASTGFLRWNTPNAKTFLGDCGSQALGALVACAGLILVTNDLHFNPWVAPNGIEIPLYDPLMGVLIVVSPFVYDVVFTLVRRTMKGASLMTAHREHLYQRHLAATGENHRYTLDFVSNYLYVAAILGVFYIRISTPDDLKVRGALLLGTVIMLGMYTTSVLNAERSNASPTE